MLTWRAKLRELLSSQPQAQAADAPPDNRLLPGEGGQQTWRDRGPQPDSSQPPKPAPLAEGSVSAAHLPEPARPATVATPPAPPCDSTGRVILRRPAPRRRIAERVSIERGVGP